MRLKINLHSSSFLTFQPDFYIDPLKGVNNTCIRSANSERRSRVFCKTRCVSCGENVVGPSCGEPGNGDDAVCESMGTQLTAHADANSEARMLRSLPRRNLLTYFSGSWRNRL